MFNFKSLTRSVFFRSRFLTFFFLIVLVSLLAILYLDRIVAFSINNFTDHRFTYDRWNGNPFARSEIEGLDFELNKGTFAVIAEKARFDFKIRQLLKERRVVLGCEMKGVTFPPATEAGSQTPPYTESASRSSADNILAIPFSPDQRYERIIFTVFLDKNTIEVGGFEAYSKDVRMKGDYTFFKNKNEISIDLKISFSPDISGMFAEGVKENILSPDEGGWYSTIISYRGNPVFLRALYSLTTAA